VQILVEIKTLDISLFILFLILNIKIENSKLNIT